MSKSKYIAQVTYTLPSCTTSTVRPVYADSSDEAGRIARDNFLDENPGAVVRSVTVTQPDVPGAEAGATR